MRRILAAAAAAVAAALVAASAAYAAERYQVRLTASDQAAARAVSLRAGDLGAGWRGGAIKPTFETDEDCADYKPRRADLVVTGAARSKFVHSSGITIESDISVLRTGAMVRHDFARTFGHPRMLPCLRKLAAAEFRGQGLTFVSMKRVPFPRLAPHTAAIRMVVKTPTGQRAAVDYVALGKGRTEIALVVAAPVENLGALAAGQRRLARLLLKRARA